MENMDILKRINKLKDDRGWSDYELAKRAGISQSTLSNLVHRGNSPTISSLEKICMAFGITLSDIFKAVEDENVDYIVEAKEVRIYKRSMAGKLNIASIPKFEMKIDGKYFV